jgi:hypothetical protein
MLTTPPAWTVTLTLEAVSVCHSPCASPSGASCWRAGGRAWRSARRWVGGVKGGRGTARGANLAVSSRARNATPHRVDVDDAAGLDVNGDGEAVRGLACAVRQRDRQVPAHGACSRRVSKLAAGGCVEGGGRSCAVSSGGRPAPGAGMRTAPAVCPAPPPAAPSNASSDKMPRAHPLFELGPRQTIGRSGRPSLARMK